MKTLDTKPFGKFDRTLRIFKVLDITEDCPKQPERASDRFLIIYAENDGKLCVYLVRSTLGHLFGTYAFWLFSDIAKQVNDESSKFGTYANTYGFTQQKLADIIIQQKPV